jgi:hypothetical protein
MSVKERQINNKCRDIFLPYLSTHDTHKYIEIHNKLLFLKISLLIVAQKFLANFQI